MHHSKHSHSGKHSSRHCSTTFQLKSKLKYILIIEILDQDPQSFWALNPEFESLLCLILNPVLFPDVLFPEHGVQHILHTCIGGLRSTIQSYPKLTSQYTLPKPINILKGHNRNVKEH